MKPDDFTFEEIDLIKKRRDEKDLTRGQKIAKTNKERYGEDYYKFVGRLGGKAKKKKKKLFGIFTIKKLK